MTTSFLLEPQPFRRGPSADVAVVVGLVSIVAVLTLFLAGAAFFGLAIAPIVTPLPGSQSEALRRSPCGSGTSGGSSPAFDHVPLPPRRRWPPGPPRSCRTTTERLTRSSHMPRGRAAG